MARGWAGGPVQGGDVSTAIELTLAEAATGTAAEVRFDAVALCEHCRGNGAEPGTPIETCPRCGGSGQLRAVTRTPFGQVMRATVCDQCDGDGRIAEQPCGVCRGRGRTVESEHVTVEVPAGIADGQRIRVTGRGHAGDRGGPPGDLYVLVRVPRRPVRSRRRQPADRRRRARRRWRRWGRRFQVPTLDGPVDLEIPAGTQPKRRWSSAAGGCRALRGRRHGDLQVVVNVVIPRRLTAEQRDLTRRLAESLTDENLRSDEGVLRKLRRAFGG